MIDELNGFIWILCNLNYGIYYNKYCVFIQLLCMIGNYRIYGQHQGFIHTFIIGLSFSIWYIIDKIICI